MVDNSTFVGDACLYVFSCSVSMWCWAKGMELLTSHVDGVNVANTKKVMATLFTKGRVGKDCDRFRNKF